MGASVFKSDCAAGKGVDDISVPQTKVGIYSGDEGGGKTLGGREIGRALRGVPNLHLTSVADLSEESLGTTDVLIVPTIEKLPKNVQITAWRGLLVKYVAAGGRIMFFCGSPGSAEVFKGLFSSVADVLYGAGLPAYGKQAGSKEVRAIPEYAINEGVNVFKPRSGTIFNLWRGRPDGMTFLHNDDFFPAGVMGLCGKGKVLVFGFALGAGPEGQDVALGDQEQRILLNGVRWLASQESCPQVKYFLPARRLKPLSEAESAVVGPTDQAPTVSVGVGKIDITPRREDGSFLPTTMRGFGARKGNSEGILDGGIWARVLVIDDGTQKIAIVSCDMIYPPPEDYLDQIRALVMPKTGIQHVIFAASHTHSGPGETSIPRVVPLIGEGIIQACKNMRPARLGCGSRMVYGIGNNRRFLHRNEEGEVYVRNYFNPALNVDAPMDPECGVVRIEDCERNVLAVLVNFTCHSSMLPVENHLISGDFTGMAMNDVEKALGSSAIALFLQGAEGDIGGSLEKSLENARILAARLSESALDILRHTDVTGNVRLGFVESDVKWPGKGGGAPTPMKLRCLALNENVLVFLAGEVFVEIGLKIKFASPFDRTFVIGVTDASPRKYFPARRAFVLGGYEVGTTYAPEDEGTLERRVGELLGGVRAR